MNLPPPYVNRAEVAQHFGVNISTVDRWIARKQIPYIKIGGTVRFKIAEIEEFKRVAPKPPSRFDLVRGVA